MAQPIVGRFELHHSYALDVVDMLTDNSSTTVQRARRASDSLSQTFVEKLRQGTTHSRNRRLDISEWMEEERRLGGKAVWTNLFLSHYAPVDLGAEQHLQVDSQQLYKDSHLSDVPDSNYFPFVYSHSRLTLYPEGVFVYTVALRSTTKSRLPSDELIVAVAALDDIFVSDAVRVAQQIVTTAGFKDACSTIKAAAIQPDQIDRDFILRRSREHRLLIVDSFYSKPMSARPDPSSGNDSSRLETLQETRVSASEMKSSPVLAGLLNATSWFTDYDPAYITRIAQKDIGYRSSELYITDRRATLVSHPGFWDTASKTTPADPLTKYREDLVLTVEYSLSRLVLCQAARNYLQNDTNAVRLDVLAPSEGLDLIVTARALLARLEESMDPAPLIDHGFTRQLLTRLMDEIGANSALSALRRRVQDASELVEVRSSVTAAENTATENLSAARQNNKLQTTILVVASVTGLATIAALIIALITILGPSSDPPILSRVCVSATPHHIFTFRSCNR